MAKRLVAYWGEGGVDIYRTAGEGRPELLCSGPPEGLKPLPGAGRQRILVLGRSNTIRLRKRYPPAKLEKLRRAVETEATTLFPLLNCSLHCRIVESNATHAILDIWAWEQEPLERLRASYDYGYVIPEELAFLASPSGVHIYPTGSTVQIVAGGEGRFMDGASYPAAGFSTADLERFLTGLADGVSLIKEITFYGDIEVDAPSSLRSRVKRLQKKDYPPFLDMVDQIPLKSFRRKTGILHPFLNRAAMFRFALYAVFAYGLMLFLTLHNYDEGIAELKNKSLSVAKEISILERSGMAQNDQDTLKDFEARIKEADAPLRTLDALAADLPEESHVKRLVFNNGIVELTVSTRDPLGVIKRLGGSERIGKISLKGSPAKEAATGIYNCALLLEMKP